MKAYKSQSANMLKLLNCCLVMSAAMMFCGCVSRLPVSSGGQTSAGHCNYRERTWGSLYGIDWCDKTNGVESQEPDKPFARVSAVVTPQDFLLSFVTLGLIIPINVQYDMETMPLPKKGGK